MKGRRFSDEEVFLRFATIVLRDQLRDPKVLTWSPDGIENIAAEMTRRFRARFPAAPEPVLFTQDDADLLNDVRQTEDDPTRAEELEDLEDRIFSYLEGHPGASTPGEG